MVQMALEQLSDREIIELDEEHKAAMVSNLLVVLCSEKGNHPVMNTGRRRTAFGKSKGSLRIPRYPRN